MIQTVPTFHRCLFCQVAPGTLWAPQESQGDVSELGAIDSQHPPLSGGGGEGNFEVQPILGSPGITPPLLRLSSSLTYSFRPHLPHLVVRAPG